MREFLSKIIRTPRLLTPNRHITQQQPELEVIGSALQDSVRRLFRGSLAIRQIDTGSDNATEQELAALTNAYYDIERFGIHFVPSPRHADMLLVTGPVTRNMAEALKRAYDATPHPKLVVAVGDDAIDGGIYRGSYAVLDGVSQVIPVDYQIAGDPPSPLAIMQSLLAILDGANQAPKQKGQSR